MFLLEYFTTPPDTYRVDRFVPRADRNAVVLFRYRNARARPKTRRLCRRVPCTRAAHKQNVMLWRVHCLHRERAAVYRSR